MRSSEVLVDAFDRVKGVVHRVLADIDPEHLTARLDPQANTVAWLVWHLTRIQDDHLAEAAGHEQVWTSQGWAERFDLPFDPAETGFGHGSADVAAVRTGAQLLAGYHDAVHESSTRWVRTLDDGDLDRVVDESWDPPVTLGVRLVSVLGDDLQHAGQAAYLHGLLQRAAGRG